MPTILKKSHVIKPEIQKHFKSSFFFLLSIDSNDGVPSSVSTPATTVLQRRSRISATPNLARPKVRSALPSTGKTVSLPSEPPKISSPFQAAKSFPHSPIPVAVSRDDSQNSTFSDATKAAYCPPSSPCFPSTSGHPSSTPSQQEPYRTPKKIPNEDFGPQEGATPISCTLSPYVKLSRVDGPDSPLRNKISSDKQQVLRALKLKELMKLEWKKERMVKSISNLLKMFGLVKCHIFKLLTKEISTKKSTNVHDKASTSRHLNSYM